MSFIGIAYFIIFLEVFLVVFAFLGKVILVLGGAWIAIQLILSLRNH